MRIGLFTTRERKKQGQSSTVTSYVDVNTSEELSAKLSELGAKRVGMLLRDRTGTENHGRSAIRHAAHNVRASPLNLHHCVDHHAVHRQRISYRPSQIIQ